MVQARATIIQNNNYTIIIFDVAMENENHETNKQVEREEV